jgi:hypothetical protein
LSNDNDRMPSIRPLRFWTEYEPDPSKPGEQRSIDKVEWVKVGDRMGSTTVSRVSHLMPRTGFKGKQYEAAIEWQAIQPAYERWKANETIPENGTPLAAWPGADRGLVDALKKLNILSVEDFVGAADHAFSSIPIPDLRKRRKMAEDFLLAQGEISHTQAELSKRDEMIDRQSREIEEMKAQLASLLAAQPKPKAQKAA